MKLNLDCVRDILLFLEKQNNVNLSEDGEISWVPVRIEDLFEGLNKYNRREVFYAVHNMEQAGLLDCSTEYADDSLDYCFINYITFEGHEFLEGVRGNKRWASVKKVAEKVGVFSFQVLASIAQSMAKAGINAVLSGYNLPVIGD